jgi:hypothetical protein
MAAGAAPPALPPLPPPPPPPGAALVSPTATTASAPPPRPLELPDASALVAPPKDDKPAPEKPEQPSALKPQASAPARPPVQKRPPTRRLEPGDLICPDCGEGNPTTRKFCSRCGASLETAQVVKKKWWQRFVPGRGPKKRKAGDRPSARKTRKSFGMKMMGFAFGGVARVIGVIFIIGGLLYGLVPGIRSGVNDKISSLKNTVNGWFHPTRTEVLPTDVFVSASTRGHGSPALKDTATNTYWAAHVPKAGSNVHLTITYSFSSKFDLKNMAIWNGIGDAKNRDYNSTERVRSVFLTFPGTSVPGCPIAFKDLPAKADTEDVSGCGANGIAEVQVRIDDFYPSSGAKVIALAKLQFYKK